MHSAEYVVAKCPSVCLSVCLSHAGIESKRILKIFFTIRYPLNSSFSAPNGMEHYSDGDPLTGASNARGYEKDHDFRPISRFISQMMQDRAIVTMES